MGSKLLKSLMSVVLVIGLMPTLALADDATGGSDATPKAGDVVQEGNVLVGATGSVDAGDRVPVYNDVTYKITLNDDLQTYTLTFDGNGEIPTYYTEAQGTAADGTQVDGKTGTVTPPWKVAVADKADYQYGYVTDSNGDKHALPPEKSDPYRFCTTNIAYYNAVPWSTNAGCKYTSNITNVVFGKNVTKIGRYTLFNFSSLKSVQVNNPDCKIDSQSIYFNGKSGSSIAIDIASTVTANTGSIAGANTSGGYTAGDVTVNITDAIAFEDEAAAAIADMSASTLTEDQKTEIKGYYATYEAGNETFKNALSSDFVKQLTTLNLAANGKMEGDAIIAKEGAVQNGVDTTGTIHYQLLTKDGGDTYTLRFYESDTVNGNGRMSDFVVKDTSGYDDYDRYQNAPWYSNTYRLKVKKVVYDKSITRTGALTACHLYNCEEFVFENPDVVLASTTIHWNDQIQASSVKIEQYASAKMEKEGGSVYWAKTQGGVNADLSTRVSFVYGEAEQYKVTFADLFAKDVSDTAEDEVSSAKAAFDSLANVCRAQLSQDKVPSGTMSYLEKLNAMEKAHGLGESDANAVVKSGVIPSSKGDAETIKYEISTADNVAYTVRFWDSDATGDGRFPDYLTELQAKEDWQNYQNLPWRVPLYRNNITKMVFDSSVKYIGQFAAANMPSCTDIIIENENASMSKNAIYFYDADQVANGTGKTYIHTYAKVNPSYGCGSLGEGDKARIHFSYIEAEQFETSNANAALWALDAKDALTKSSEIEAAYAAYGNLPAKAQEQLNSDTIADSSTTYFGKLSELMAAIGKGGSCGENAQYVISDNGATLTISGTGAVSSSPWTAYEGAITKVVLSSGIESVSAGVFSNLTNLDSVDVAQSVTDIADGAFPTTDFTMYGWMNHASGKYCDAHSNASLKLKELRILCMGNSHTVDYTAWLNNVIGDMSGAGMNTKITFERLTPKGGRGLYEEQGSYENKDGRSSHYVAAHAADGQKDGDGQDLNTPYKEAFAKTWDVVVAQDYHESTKLNDTYGGANYVDDMQKVVSWLRSNDAAPGAKIVWFADWAEKSANGADKLDKTYDQSIAAIEAVEALGEKGPDHIIAAATVLQNARTSFLGSVMNPNDVLLNNKRDDGSYVFSDCAKDSMGSYTVLERDATHMSLELGRQLMAENFAFDMCSWLGGKLDAEDRFTVLGSLKTAPDYRNGNVYWQGEFTPEIWNVIAESCYNAAMSPRSVTQSYYTADPFADKWAKVKQIVGDAIPAESTSLDAITAAVKSDTVVSAINAVDVFSRVTSDDVVVTYMAPIDGTVENGAGIDGKLEISVNYHYGYSFPTGPAYTKTIPASTTLQYKIDNAADGATVSLDADTVEAITIPVGKTITLNLNGHKLANAAEPQDKTVSSSLRHHTIINNGTLTIVDSVGGGIVDNVSHGRGALWNNAGATVTVSGGTFMRSAESSTGKDGDGGNSWYTIKNYGNMTINGENVKVMSSSSNVGSFSSLIANGWYDTKNAGTSEPALTTTGTTLTITNGAFDGGLNTVKNDTYGHLNISGGAFTNQVQAAIMNWNTASISGGTFAVADGAEAVLLNGAASDKTANSGVLTVSGGTFTAPEGATLIAKANSGYDFGTAAISDGTFEGSFSGDLPTGDNGLTVSGGTFSDETFEKYCEDGFAPSKNEETGTYSPAIAKGWTTDLSQYSKDSAPDATTLGYTADEAKTLAFAGWYVSDAEDAAACDANATGKAYAKFVKITDLIKFRGGSLRIDGPAVTESTSFRFGYFTSVPDGAEYLTSGWNWFVGQYEQDYAEAESRVVYEDGSAMANLVVTELPTAWYGTNVKVREHLEYLTADGTKVAVDESDYNARSVYGVAEKIVKSGAGKEQKDYAQSILDIKKVSN